MEKKKKRIVVGNYSKPNVVVKRKKENVDAIEWATFGYGVRSSELTQGPEVVDNSHHHHHHHHCHCEVAFAGLKLVSPSKYPPPLLFSVVAFWLVQDYPCGPHNIAFSNISPGQKGPMCTVVGPPNRPKRTDPNWQTLHQDPNFYQLKNSFSVFGTLFRPIFIFIFNNILNYPF